MSTTKEKLQVAVLVLAFPLLMAAAYAIREYREFYTPKRKRLAELDEAEREAGCETGESWDR